TAPPATPIAPAAVVDRVKAALLAGIDAINQRMTSFRAAVETDPATYSASGTPGVLFDHVWYVRAMLDALFDIGGPCWEIETAADMAKAQGVKKGHKAITGARVAKMRGIHKAMSYACKDMGGLIDELGTDEEETAPKEELSFAKAATTTAAPAATAAVDPAHSAALAELEKKIV